MLLRPPAARQARWVLPLSLHVGERFGTVHKTQRILGGRLSERLKRLSCVFVLDDDRERSAFVSGEHAGHCPRSFASVHRAPTGPLVEVCSSLVLADG